MDRIKKNRNRNTAAAATPKSKFTAPTPWIEYVHLTHGNIKAAAEFGTVRRKFSIHIISKYKCVMGSNMMEEMAHPTTVKPVEPIREFKIDNSTPPN